MLKRYYTLAEAAEFLTSEGRAKLSTRDVLELGARGKLSVCVYVADRLMAPFNALGELHPGNEVKPGDYFARYFKGYVQLDQELLSPIMSFPLCVEDRFEVKDEIESTYVAEPWMHVDWRAPSGYRWMLCEDPDTVAEKVDLVRSGKYQVDGLRIGADDLVIPAQDLLTLESDNRTSNRAVIEVEQDRPLTTKERNMLLTMIYVLCRCARLDPTKHSTTAKAIVDAAAEEGIELSVRGVGNHLSVLPLAVSGRTT